MITKRSSGARKTRTDWRDQTFTLSHAKTYLGRLVEKAAKGETVYIAKGRHRYVLQQVPEIEPIPFRPPGYFANCYTPEEIREENLLAKSSVIRPPKDLE
jgi:hypothetical protein